MPEHWSPQHHPLNLTIVKSRKLIKMATSSIKVERSARFITPKARASYPHLFTPKAFEDGEPKYQLTAMVKKDEIGDAFVKMLKEKQEQALTALYGKKLPANIDRYGVNDGDDSEDPEMHGHWLVKSTNKAKPACVDADNLGLVDKSIIYGGCYIRANMCAKAYGTPSKGGVSLELVAVQFMGDGEPFSAAARASMAAAGEFDEAKF